MGLPTGTELRNVASIRFDRQNTITTNQIDPENPSAGVSTLKEALNTIDSDIPSSNVETLAKKVFTTAFDVKWNGTDNPLGTGVSTYDVLVSVDNGPYTEWLDRTPTTSSVYTGILGHTYSFISIAFDNTGNQEPVPATADATTRVSRPPRLSPWNPIDVDDDGDVSPLDVLIVVNSVNRDGFRTLVYDPEEAPFYDTNGNNSLETLDILQIVNYLNKKGEGEGEVPITTVDREDSISTDQFFKAYESPRAAAIVGYMGQLIETQDNVNDNPEDANARRSGNKWRRNVRWS